MFMIVTALFCNDEEVFLLALLHEEILVVEKVSSGENLVGICELFLLFFRIY